LALSPVLSRLYSPAQFGELALFAAVAAIMAIPASLRLEFAIPTAASSAEASLLMWVGLYVSFVSAVVVTSGVLAAEALTGLPSLGEEWVLLGLCVMLINGYGLDAARMVWGGAHSRLGARAFTQMSGQLAVQLHAGWFGSRAGLIVGYTLGRGAALLVPSAISRGSLPSVREAARVVASRRGFITRVVPAGLMNMSAQAMPVVIMSYWFGRAETGSLALVLRVVGVPVGLVALSVGQAYLGALGTLLREDPEKICALVSRLVRRLLVIVGAPLLAVGSSSPWLFPALFGAQWHTAGLYALLMTPGVLAQAIVSPLSATLIATQRTGWQLAWDAGRMVSLGLVFLAAGHLKPAMCVGLISCVWLLTYSVLYGLILRSVASVAGARIK
jgi:O-antigen/teichoic acid export membrane protein